MTRRTIYATLAAVPLTTLLAAPADAAIRCHEEYKRETVVRNNGTTGDDDWLFAIGHGYNVCIRTPGRDYATLQYSLYGYDQEGSSMSCNPVTSGNRLRHVEFNSVFKDASNRIFNPPPVRAQCDEDTSRVVTAYYDVTPRLRYFKGSPPTAATTIRVEKAFPVGELDVLSLMYLTRNGKQLARE